MSTFFFRKSPFHYLLYFLLLCATIIPGYSQVEEGIWRNGVFYKTRPLPINDGLQQPFTDQLKLLEYNLQTKKTTARLAPSMAENPTRRQSSSSKGIVLDTTGQHLTERNFSSISRIEDPSIHPWRVNVKLLITFPSYTSQCSGVLIDPSFVLTAGHCIYDEEAGIWADAVTVIPGYDNGNEPYGAAEGLNFYSWNGWTRDASFDWDMAYIQLDRPIGAIVGWHDYGYNNANTFFTDNTFHNPGYPAESPFNGEDLYYWFGDFDDAGTHQICTDNIASGGQSGSGSYFKNSDDERIVYAVLSNTGLDVNDNRTTPTCHNRINNDRFNSIYNTIDEQTSNTPDLIPLHTRATPSVVNSGAALTDFRVLIYNNSQATFSGAVTAKIYLSTNKTISTTDNLIRTVNYDLTLNPKDFTNAFISSNLPIIPSNISTGNYYLGVILEVSDANGNNNYTVQDDVASIFVTNNNTLCNTSWNLNDFSISPTTYYAERTITASGRLASSSNTIFKAGNSITLNPNFHAIAGSTFSAIIENVNCTNFSSNPDLSITQKNVRDKLQENASTSKQFFLECSPNPATHSLTVTYSLAQAVPAYLFFYNIEGSVIFKKSLPSSLKMEERQINIDLSPYESGFYYLALVGEYSQVTEKVIIMD